MGRYSTVERWVAWFDEEDARADPTLAVTIGWYHALAGDEDPIRWLRLAEALVIESGPPREGGALAATVALLRAALCLKGPQRMDEDVALAAELGAPTSEWRVIHHLVAGEAALLLGDVERARTMFHDAVEFAGPAQAGGHAVALSELGAMAIDDGDWVEARRWIDRARDVATSYGLGDAILQPLMFAVSALILARQGDPDGARRELTQAQKLRATSSFAMPSFSIRGRLLMARAYLALSDVEGARTVLREARDFQAHRPNIGTLTAAIDGVERAVDALGSSGISGPATLSAAELRVLALLPTYLPFADIGRRLFVSANTVKSHAMSIYRKLGVSSRTSAVERAVALGLLEE
jgi:LuxR family maltose regulon positive regulatory protein